MAEVKKLNEEIESPALSKEAKETKSKSRDEKVSELKGMDREVGEFRTTREKQLQEQSGRMAGRAGCYRGLPPSIYPRLQSGRP